MFYKLFKSYNPVLVLLFPIMVVLMWLNTFINLPEQHLFSFDTFQAPVYQVISSWFQGSVVFSSLLAMALILIQAFMVVRLNSKYILIQERTYLPAFFYILLSTAFIELQRLNPAVITGVLLLIVIEKMFDSYKDVKLSYNYFESSLLISAGSLIYPGFLFFIMIVWVGLLVLRHFNWREWVFTFIGLVIPYLFYFCYYYIFRLETAYPFERLLVNFCFKADIFRYVGLPYYLLYSLLGFFIIISTYRLVITFYVQKVQNRNFFLILVWLQVISLVLLFFVPAVSAEALFFIAIPSSLILGYYFQNLKARWLGEVVFFGFFLLILLIEYYEQVKHYL
jgi:hypothetical protein